MVSRNAVRKIGFSALLMLVCICMAAPIALAQEEHAEEEGEADSDDGLLGTFALAFGAALAVALTGLATAMAQTAVGAGGTAAMAEKPELFGSVLILFAIPETIVILGFVIAFLLVQKIG